MQDREGFRYESYRVHALLGSAGFVVTIAVVDAIVKPYISLSFFYLFPIMIAAAFIPRWTVAITGLVCAGLSALYGGLPMSWVRVGFETLAFAGCGLFAGELFRNRQASLAAQGRMQILIETSPAAILTVNSIGIIEMANQAAVVLLAPREGRLLGMPVAAFLPELHYALGLGEGPQLRSMLQCKGHRGKGETFTADVWFSTYAENGSPKLAAILADVSEETAAVNGTSLAPSPRAEFSARETEVLRLVVQGAANKEIASQVQLSESTIKATLQQLFAKTGVRTRAQLVRVALEQYRDLL